MSNTPQSPTHSHAWVDHIPVIWFEPQVQHKATIDNVSTSFQ